MGAASAARLPSMRNPLKRRTVARFETISARPLKSSAALQYRARRISANLQVAGAFRDHQFAMQKQCAGGQVDGSRAFSESIGEVFFGRAANSRPSAETCRSRSRRHTCKSDDLDGNGRENATAKGQMELMRSGQTVVRQEQIDLVALLQRDRCRKISRARNGDVVDRTLRAAPGRQFPPSPL